jgi:hypothetical protein
MKISSQKVSQNKNKNKTYSVRYNYQITHRFRILIAISLRRVSGTSFIQDTNVHKAYSTSVK